MRVTYRVHIREMRGIAFALSLVAVVAMRPSVGLAAGCGPFGDSPQTVVSDPVPICLGGTRLGPWNDSDSTPRYACLYTPAAASSSNPLPMLVWLHLCVANC